jgi:hypothetical protein
MKVILKNKNLINSYHICDSNFISTFSSTIRNNSNIWNIKIIIEENDFYIGKYYFYTNRSKTQVASYYGSILGRILYLSEITQ